MARTFKDIKIEDKTGFVLFDTGSIRSYIRKEFASKIRWRTIPLKIGLGGRFFEIDEACALNCAIEGLEFDIEAHPVEEIGTEFTIMKKKSKTRNVKYEERIASTFHVSLIIS